jgi:hypothetical protein
MMLQISNIETVRRCRPQMKLAHDENSCRDCARHMEGHCHLAEAASGYGSIPCHDTPTIEISMDTVRHSKLTLQTLGVDDAHVYFLGTILLVRPSAGSVLRPAT